MGYLSGRWRLHPGRSAAWIAVSSSIRYIDRLIALVTPVWLVVSCTSHAGSLPRSRSPRCARGRDWHLLERLALHHQEEEQEVKEQTVLGGAGMHVQGPQPCAPVGHRYLGRGSLPQQLPGRRGCQPPLRHRSAESETLWEVG